MNDAGASSGEVFQGLFEISSHSDLLSVVTRCKPRTVMNHTGASSGGGPRRLALLCPSFVPLYCVWTTYVIFIYSPRNNHRWPPFRCSSDRYLALPWEPLATHIWRDHVFLFFLYCLGA